jgi:hypothetical protein
MTYVNLNPISAGMADTPERPEYTIDGLAICALAAEWLASLTNGGRLPLSIGNISTRSRPDSSSGI